MSKGSPKKRASPKKPARNKARSRARNNRRSPNKVVHKASIFDRMIGLLPFTDAQLRRGLTFILVLLFSAGLYALAQFVGLFDGARQIIGEQALQAGFEVKRIEVRNVKRMDRLKVYETVLTQKNRSMPLVDLDQMRQELLQYGWIADARISRQLPDTLIVDILEREPRAIWVRGDRLVLIDDQGVQLEEIGVKDKDKEGDLLLVCGKTVQYQVPQLLELIDHAPALIPLIDEAEWIGNRRWNLSFDSGETLALPEGKHVSAAALVKFARLEGVNHLLGQGISYFDMRNPDRAYFRKPDKSKVLIDDQEEATASDSASVTDNGSDSSPPPQVENAANDKAEAE